VQLQAARHERELATLRRQNGALREECLSLRLAVGALAAEVEAMRAPLRREGRGRAAADGSSLADLSRRGVDVAELRRLARSSAQLAELSQALKDLGISKIGHRQRLIQELCAMK